MEREKVYVVGTVRSRHTFFAVFPELGDPPQWTQEQLRELNARNIEWNGKKYTAYEISQMQRARERNVRRWKKRYLAEDAAGLDPTDAAVRLRAARQSLAEFAQATGGRVDSARTSVPKFGRSEASRASAQARKAGDLPMRHVRNVFPHENAAGEKCSHSNRKKVEKHETCIGLAHRLRSVARRYRDFQLRGRQSCHQNGRYEARRGT